MRQDLTGRRVLIAVGGGIAAYKVIDVVRRLIKRGAEVRIMMTRSATRFVHPTTFSAISGHAVGLDMFSDSGRAEVDHLELPHWADVVLVAPATADLIAKMACGIADDLVSTGLLAAKCPVLIAPAMNTSMYENPATQANLKTLNSRGIRRVGPEYGDMAAPGEKPGLGRMSEPAMLEEAVASYLVAPGRLAGKKVVVTAGRTEEAIDKVRILTNRSSGRMGVEIARAARSEGAEVVLVHGAMDVDPPDNVRTVRIHTALDLLEAVKLEVVEADMVFYVAAVSDWRPKQAFEGKMKREGMEGPPVIELTENPDIAAETAPSVKGMAIGFALEVDKDESLAIGKMKKKGLDAILFNRAEAIGSEENELTWLSADGARETSGPGRKRDLARWIMDRAVKRIAE